MSLEHEKKLRLYCETDLKKLQETHTDLLLSNDQGHYIRDVMRRRVGDPILLVDGLNGEYLSFIVDINRKEVCVRLTKKIKDLYLPADLWLIFSPIKKMPTDFIVEKATELGVREIKLVVTNYTNLEKVNIEKLRLKIIGAIQQCGGTFIPKISKPVSLSQLLKTWPVNRQLIFCDESMRDIPIQESLKFFGSSSAAILVGPEGGFSEEESNIIRSSKNVLSVSLGSRILRADTAALASITIWHSVCGDWTIS